MNFDSSGLVSVIETREMFENLCLRERSLHDALSFFFSGIVSHHTA